MIKNYFNEKGIVNFPKIRHGYLVFVFSAVLLLTLQNDAAAQKKPPPKTADQILFEVSRKSFGSGNRREKTLFIFKSGRVNCKTSESLRVKKKSIVSKPRCFQISQAVIANLSKIASQPDFLAADEEYNLPGGGVDYSYGITIISFLNKENKKILLQAGYFGEDVSPASVEDFVNEIVKIDGSLKLLPEVN